MKNQKNKKEVLINIPNLLTLVRVLITFIIFYLAIEGYSLTAIASFFIVGMITDALDGHIARRYNQKTEFGRKFDMIADRFLLIGTVISILISNFLTGYLGKYEMLLVSLVLTREILSFPFLLLLFYLRLDIPHARFIGKLVTVLQAISFPMVLLKWSIAPYFVAVTAVAGVFSAARFIYDTLKIGMKQKS